MLRRAFTGILLIACAALALSACEKTPVVFNSTDITGAEYGQSLRLTDQYGESRSMADFSGKVVAVFFGFTQCPDVCPTSLGMLANVIKQLGPEGEKLQVVFVTVDPERDTQALLKQYMAAFHPTFIGLYGSLDETAAVAKAFKVFYQKRVDAATGTYTMDHTAGIYLFDPKGRTRLFSRNGETPERLMADIKLLMQGK